MKRVSTTRRAEIANLSLAEVLVDPVLMATADRIFRRECSACHGIDGRGQASLFPNLMDTDWQWGRLPRADRTNSPRRA